jgi:hypothetical protein
MSNTIQLHTDVSGHFSVYIPDENNNLELITQSRNLVVNTGLDAVGTTFWANCLQRCLAGSGTKEVSSTDTSMDVLELSSLPNSPAAPACYTLAEYDPNIPDNGITYRIGKTWRLDNNTGVDKTITELGVTTTPSGSANLFSRSLVDPSFVLPKNRFAFIVYELRLKTGISSARQDFQVTTDGNEGFAFPTGSKLGIYNCPVAYLNSAGTLVNNLTAAGQAMFEPCTPNYWLYYLRNNTAGGVTSYFEPKRDWFESTQATLLSGNNVALPNPLYTNAHTNGHQFSNDDNGTYVPGSYKRVHHIIVSPEVPSLSENVFGFAVVNQSTAANVSQRGLHCVFPEPWVRPTNTFTKFYFEQTWSAIP